ncbi:MAG: hypothetical protein ACM30E_01560 [Nitrososphaerales archaeon]
MNRCILLGMLPADFEAHRRGARRERLLSWRSLLDAAIERLDETPAGAGRRTRLGLVPREFWSHRRAARREELLAFRSLVEACIGKLEAPAPAERATRIDVM